MAYTAEQIASLPISDPKLKAKFAASQGVPLATPVSNPLIDAVAPPPAPVPAASAAPTSVNMPPPAAPYEPKYVASVGNPTPVLVNKPPTLADDPMFGGPQPAPAAPSAPSPLLPNVPVIGPPALPAGIAAPPPKPGGPMPPTMGGGPALPLQAPAAMVGAEGLYHGKDPYSFGLTPGQQKLQTLQGQRLYGEGQFAEQDAAIDANTAQDYSGVAQQVAADADARAAAAQKKAADRQAFLAKYNADTERQINDYANAKIDPGRLWAGSQGTGNAIAATIGSFVAGVAGFMDPSKDYVGQFANRIEAKIQQDIDLQKAEIAKKGAGIEARRGLYGSYLQQFGQEDAAEAMAYETYLRKTKAHIDSYASKATSEKAKVQLGALSAALEDRQKMWAANRQAAGESMIDAYYAAQAKAQAQAAAAAGAKADEERKFWRGVAAKGFEEAMKKFPGSQLMFDKSGQPIGVVDPNNKLVYAPPPEATGNVVNLPVMQGDGSLKYRPLATPNPDAAKAVQQKSAGAVAAIKAIDQMQAAAAMPGPWVGKKYELYKQAISNYSTAYGQAKGLGALSKDDLALVWQTVPALPTYGVGYQFSSEADQLKSQKQAMTAELEQIGNVYGMPGAAPQVASSLGPPVDGK